MKGLLGAIKGRLLFMIPGVALTLWGLIELSTGPSCDYQPMVPGETCSLNGGTPLSYGRMASGAHVASYTLLVIGAVLLLGGAYVGARAGHAVPTDPRRARRPESGRAAPRAVRRRARADLEAALQRVESDPENLDIILEATDAAMDCGAANLAIDLTLEAVRQFGGPPRDRARQRLLGYLDRLGPEDPRVRQARARLSSVLF